MTDEPMTPAREPTITVTLTCKQLSRLLGDSEFIDGDEIIWKANKGADWIQKFCRDSVVEHLWGRLCEMAETQKLRQDVNNILEKYGEKL